MQDQLKLTGAYYFGNSWPVTTWGNFRKCDVERYLKKMVEDYFNTVIIIVPASIGNFRIDAPEVYYKFLEDFTYLIDAIKNRNLNVMLRIGYIWDSLPVNFDRVTNCAEILFYENSADRFIEAVDALWKIVGEYDRYLGGFITWEDFLVPASRKILRKTETERIKIAKDIRYRNGDCPIPNGPENITEDYLEKLDDLFIRLFYKLQAKFGKISAEVRLDHTPFKKSNGETGYYIHNSQYSIESEFINTYFATYFLNEAADLDIKSVLDSSHQKVFEAIPNRKVFVDQLLLFIKEELAKDFADVSIEVFRSQMIPLIEWLDEKSIGYANWAFCDYLNGDIVTNACFRYGLSGWFVKGLATINHKNNHFFVELISEASISAKLASDAHMRLPECGLVHVEFESDSDASFEISVNQSESFLVDSLTDVRIHKSNANTNSILLPFKKPADRLVLKVASGTLFLRKFTMGKELASNGGRSLDLEKTPCSVFFSELNKSYLDSKARYRTGYAICSNAKRLQKKNLLFDSNITHVIHMGVHKTGSSSLQEFLNLNRKKLINLGFDYPEPPALHLKAGQQLLEMSGLYAPDDVVFSKTTIKSNELASIVEPSKQPNHKKIFSFEALYQITPDILKAHFHSEKTVAVLYIRNQYDYLRSAYAQAIHETNRTYNFSTFNAPENFFYLPLLENLSNIYSQRFIPRIYHKDLLNKSDVRADFIDILGYNSDDSSWEYSESNSNPSIGGSLLKFKLLINTVIDLNPIELFKQTYFPLSKMAAQFPEYRGLISLPKSIKSLIEEKYRKHNLITINKYFTNVNPDFLCKGTDSSISHEHQLKKEDIQLILDRLHLFAPSFVNKYRHEIYNASTDILSQVNSY